jgi:hypothetical protein
MKVAIKPSDLQYLYHRNQQNREQPKFTGLPDPQPFDRDDLYEVIPMLEAVMAALESRDGQVLQECERLMIFELPKFLTSREEVFNCLLEVMRERLGRSRA